MKHVDEWLDEPSWEPGETYAKWFLETKRMPAWKMAGAPPQHNALALFCNYENKGRFRCTGASRMGDVWLTPDFGQEHGYKLRVDVAKCGNWGPMP